MGFFLVMYLLYLFRLDTSSPRGDVGRVTFRSRYLSFRCMPPCHASGPQECIWHDVSLVLALVSPFISTMVHLAIVPFPVFCFCRGAFSVSPSLATPVVRGRSLMGRLLYYRVCVFFNCFSSRVFLASQPGCQGCGSAL